MQSTTYYLVKLIWLLPDPRGSLDISDAESLSSEDSIRFTLYWIFFTVFADRCFSRLYVDIDPKPWS